MAPADERLNAPQRSGSQCEQRLVEEEELVVGDGPAQVEVEIVVGGDAGVPVGVKDAEASAAGAFGLVQGDVGLPQEHARAGQRVGRDDGADTGGDGEVGALPHEALADSSHRSTGDQACVGLGTQVGVQQNELVPPDAGHRVTAPRDPGQAPAHLGQHRVTGVVAERVVDGLEVVEVDEEQPDTAMVAVQGCQGLGQAVHERQPVGHPGEAVVKGLVPELRFGSVASQLSELLQRNVPDQETGTPRKALRSSDRSDPALEPPRARRHL